MKKATIANSPVAPFTDNVRKQPSPASLILSTAMIMVASITTATIAMVAVAAYGEVSHQINSAAIDTFLDLIATIFFTLLNVIAAGADSVQMGFMVGIYVGIALSALYLVNSWLFVQKGRHLFPAWRRGQ
jgi:hypothetical protein